MGIEPTLLAWEASALPLSYTRTPLTLKRLYILSPGLSNGRYLEKEAPESSLSDFQITLQFAFYSL